MPPPWASLLAGAGATAVVALAVFSVYQGWDSRETRGDIYVDTPEVYTRERLVNDRFREEAWLGRQLRRTDVLMEEGGFAGVEAWLARRDVTEMMARLKGGVGQGVRTGTGDEASSARVDGTTTRPDEVTLAPNPIDEFRDAQAYRDVIRAELMRTQLDDRHDIEGNTLYRLDFDATISPGDNTGALALITVTLQEVEEEKRLPIYEEVYDRLHKDLQAAIDDAIEAQAKDFLGMGGGFQGAEEVAFQEHIQAELCGAVTGMINTLYEENEEGKEDTDAGKNDDPSESAEGLCEQLELTRSINDYVQEYLLLSTQKQEIDWANSLLQKAQEVSATNIDPTLQKIRTASPDALSSPLDSEAYERLAQLKAYAVSRCQEPQTESFSLKGSARVSQSDELTFPCPLPTVRGEVAAISMLQMLRRPSQQFQSIKRKLEDERQERINNNGFQVGNQAYFVRNLVRVLGALDQKPENDLPGAEFGKRLVRVELPQQSFMRWLLANFMLDKLNHRRSGYQVRLPIDDLFGTGVGGCQFGGCTVLLKLRKKGAAGTPDEGTADVTCSGQTEWADHDTICAFQDLLNRDARAFSYAIMPTEWTQSLATEELTRASLHAAVEAAAAVGEKAVEAALAGLKEFETRLETRHRNPLVIGFGDPSGEEESVLTKFGWVIRPQILPQLNNGQQHRRQTARSYPLGALVSIPSWWRLLKLEVTKCWIDEESLISLPPAAVTSRCEEDPDYRVHYVQVPGSVKEIKEKLKYEVRVEPYIDFVATNQHQSLEIGRAGQVVLEGGRLWRSTVVRMGNQQADNIAVLPNMKGIIAEFSCVLPPAGESGAQDPGQSPVEFEQQVHVWTSEGRTATPLTVYLRRFQPRNASSGEKVRELLPCYLTKDKEDPVSIIGEASLGTATTSAP